MGLTGTKKSVTHCLMSTITEQYRHYAATIQSCIKFFRMYFNYKLHIFKVFQLLLSMPKIQNTFSERNWIQNTVRTHCESINHSINQL